MVRRAPRGNWEGGGVNLFIDLSSRLGGVGRIVLSPAPRHIWSHSEHLAEFHQPCIFRPWH